MDSRNYKSGAIETAPIKLVSPSVGFPQGGDPATGTPATVPGAFYHYAMAEEMRNVIVNAGLTPNDDELDQFWQAIQTLLIIPPGAPTGSIVIAASSAVPDGHFEADGSAVSRTTYADLFAEIGDSFGAGDGSTTFNIPDLRGEFIRGWDHGAGSDPNAASRAGGDTVGSSQNDEIKTHTHNTGLNTLNGAAGTYFTTNHQPGAPAAVPTGSTGGSETRPRNIAMMFCIKF